MTERIRKIRNNIKQNFDENADLYVGYVAGMIAGAITLAVVRKVPSAKAIIDVPASLNAFLAGVEAAGHAVFVLSPQQAEVYRTAWAAAEAGIAG